MPSGSPMRAKALSRLGAAAVPALTAALADPKYKARRRVVAILARRGGAHQRCHPDHRQGLE